MREQRAVERRDIVARLDVAQVWKTQVQVFCSVWLHMKLEGISGLYQPLAVIRLRLKELLLRVAVVVNASTCSLEASVAAFLVPVFIGLKMNILVARWKLPGS